MIRSVAGIGILFIVVLSLILSACWEENFNFCDPPSSLRHEGADDPVLALAGTETVVAGWTQAFSGSSNIRAYIVHFEFGWGWFYSSLVDDDGDGQVTLLRVAGSTDGKTEFAAWYKITPQGNRVYATRFLNQIYGRWETAVPLTDSVTVLDLAVAADGLGNAIVIWVQPDISYNRLYARRYTPETGWDAAQAIDDNTGNCTLPRITADASGNAVAVWQLEQGNSTAVYANGFGTTTGWDSAQMISNGSGNAYNPDAAMNSSGAAVSVWHQDDAGTYNAYAARYIPGAGWETPQLIESGSSNADRVNAGIDDAGAVLAVWRQGDIYFNRFMPGTGWGAEQTIAQGFVDDPEISVNPEGKAIAVWNQWDQASEYPGDALVYARKFDPANGWETAANLMTEQGSANSPQAVMDFNGHATVVWSQTAASTTGGTITTVFTSSY